jgi:hypothetical protein
MATSTVEYTNIDEEFPIAGQDNDSQGFRDNFSVIKQGLENTSSELSGLLTNSASKATDNDFNGNKIINASLRAVTDEVYNGNSNVNSESSGIIDWSDGSYMNVTVTSDVTLTLGGWAAAGKLSKMRLAIKGNSGGAHTISFAAANAGTIRVNSTFPTPFTVANDSSTPTMVDAWTSDGGSTVYLQYHGIFQVLV